MELIKNRKYDEVLKSTVSVFTGSFILGYTNTLLLEYCSLNSSIYILIAKYFFIFSSLLIPTTIGIILISNLILFFKNKGWYINPNQDILLNVVSCITKLVGIYYLMF